MLLIAKGRLNTGNCGRDAARTRISVTSIASKPDNTASGQSIRQKFNRQPIDNPTSSGLYTLHAERRNSPSAPISQARPCAARRATIPAAAMLGRNSVTAKSTAPLRPLGRKNNAAQPRKKASMRRFMIDPGG